MSPAPRDRLVISYEYGSQSLFAICEAAQDLCEIVWLADLSSPEMTQMARLMERTGTVVDVAGLSGQQVVESVAAARPTGVLSLNDDSTTRLADIALALDLEFHSPEVARMLTDKLLQRQAFRAAGISTPKTLDVPVELDLADVDQLASGVGFPAVLKPRRGNGSRNTFRVHSREELIRLLMLPGLRQQEGSGMILETYLVGPDQPVSRFDPIVSVESFVHGEAVHHFALTGRLAFAEPFRETGLVLPSDLSPGNTEAAVVAATAAISALGVRHGCLHTELKFTPEGPRIIEVNGRMGGGIPQLVKLAGGGHPVLKVAMELALGRTEALRLPIRYSRIGWERTVVAPVSADRVESIAGLDALRDVPGLEQITINRRAGEQVNWRHGIQDYIYQVYGSASDYDEVERNCAAVERAVTVTYEERPQHRARNMARTP